MKLKYTGKKTVEIGVGDFSARVEPEQTISVTDPAIIDYLQRNYEFEATTKAANSDEKAKDEKAKDEKPEEKTDKTESAPRRGKQE